MSIKKKCLSQFNDGEAKLDSLGMEWKNFMKECLMKTEIMTDTVLDEENENRFSVNPSLVMDIRHAMVKNHDIVTVIPPSKELLQTNTMKLIREEKYKKLIQQKRERMIKNEIEKLKAALESYRNENTKQMEEITKDKIKHQIRLLKFSKKYPRFLKHSELQFKNQYEAKNCNNFLKVTIKSASVRNEGCLNEPSPRTERMAECFSEPVFYDRKGSMASFENDSKTNKLECYDLLNHEGKYLIMQKFFDRNYSENELDGQNIYINQLPMEKEHQIESPKNNVENEEKSEENEKKNIVLNQNELSEQNFDGNKSPAKVQHQIDSPESNNEDEILETKEELMRKFSKRHIKRAWIAWKNFTKARMKRKNEKKEFENKIEKFFNKLEESKKARYHLEIKKQNLELTNDKSQKNFNECNTAKNKLEEKVKLISNKKNRKTIQNREEKLKVLIEEVKASQKEAYQRLIEMEKQNGQGMEKVKVLKTLVNVIDNTPAKAYPTPHFLLRMEKRVEERKNRWNEIQDKRKKLEEQKENERKLKKEGELQAEEQEKKKKLEELRQKRIREKEKKERLLKEKEKLALQMNIAERHHRKTLLRSKFKLWSKLMALRQFQDEQAKDFYQRKLFQYTLTEWWKNAKESQKLKQEEADKFYEKNLRKFYFRIWTENCEERCKQLQVAVDWNDLRVTEKFFKNWLNFTLQENLRFLELKKLADLNYEKKLKMKFLNLLRNYPDVKRCELEREERKQFWRQKVLEILPDYCPVEIFE